LADIIVYLSYIGIVLLVALLSSMLCTKLRIPNMIVLIPISILLTKLSYNGQALIEFPGIFLTGLSLLALAMVLFDSASRFKLKDFDSFSTKAFWISMIIYIATSSALTALMHYMMGISWIPSMILSTAVSGTAIEFLFSAVEVSKNKAVELLKLESFFNTPLTIIIPLFIAEAFVIGKSGFSVSGALSLIPLLKEIIIGIGAGVVVGLMLLKVVYMMYDERYSPIALIVASLLAYVLAESLSGSGLWGVAALGFFFGNTYIKKKVVLQEFSGSIATLLSIFVFIMLAFVIQIRITLSLLAYALVIYAALIAVRYLVFNIAYLRSFNQKEKVFLAFQNPKGIALIVAMFMLASYSIAELQQVLQLGIVIMFYSIISSAIFARFSKFFIKGRILNK